MNIVFVIFSLNSGGMENYLLRFLKINHQKFNKVYVWCKNGVGGELEKKYSQIPNVQVIIESLPHFSFKYMSFRNLLKEKQVDTVCDFTGNYAGLVMYNANKAKVNKRIVFHRRSSNAFEKNILKLLYNQIVNKLNRRYATNVLANSKTGMNFFYGSGWENKSKYKVIYNDIIIEPFLKTKSNLKKQFNISDDSFVIGHTGRYDEAKNHKTVIKVAEEIVKKYDNVYFICCGTGVKKGLNDIVFDLGIENKVLLFESRLDIPEFLNTMDCFYFPSVTEGQPNSLIEAIISGVPIVASNIDAIKETVDKDYHTQLIDPLSVDLAIEKIEELINKKKTKQSFIRLQQATIERYGKGNNFNMFLKVLQN